MKKTILKYAVFLLTFVIALIVIGKIMNKGHDNLTLDMPKASYPLVTMVMEGTEYNQLHGYAHPMDISFQRESVTVLGEDRNIDFLVDTFGCNVSKISVEVRNLTGTRLIESTEIIEFQQKDDLIKGSITLKDLIQEDVEYSLSMVLTLDNGENIYYYTKAVWGDDLHVREKLDFVLDFHNRLYNRDSARELTKYLETNSRLEDNTSFHKVNIHSSFKQITWGELAVQERGEPVVNLTNIANSTGTFIIDYIVTTGSGKDTVTYMVEEYFRVRYSKERMYLLDYERTMNQMPDPKKMYANDKILLGITDTNVDMVESEDGNIVCFVAADRLYAYNIGTNKLTLIFSFYDEENSDWRTLYNKNKIAILDVDEGGNVKFAVYGYMNRGLHEGEVGVLLYAFDGSTNTIEELIYIPSDKTYSALTADLGQLMYLNREGCLFLHMDNQVYRIDTRNKNVSKIVQITQDDELYVSNTNRIIVWPQGDDVYNSRMLNLVNLNDERKNNVSVGEMEAILPLGFMEEDVIYGVARKEDIRRDASGKMFFPMYKICICDSNGNPLKEYSQDGIYITDCEVEENQITLSRLQRDENGVFKETYQDQIMNNTEELSGRNKIVAADIDIYERYVQIQLRSNIDVKGIQILNPKEVVYEGGRAVNLESESPTQRYYVYGATGISGIYNSPARAVMKAYEIAGSVVDSQGDCVWIKSNRVSKNQIMAIKEAESDDKTTSLAVCLDTIFHLEGLTRNSQYLLRQGKTTLEILEENLDDAKVLDLSGCSLDQVLYYVNQDIPVLVTLKDGEAVLITGFNEYNVVIMEPSTGKLYKKGMNDSTEWFEENGNSFITYMRIAE